MMMEQKLVFDKAFLRNVQNNILYEYLGENKYRNTITDVVGEVNEETAKRVFKINMGATFILSNYPLVESLIKTFNLKIENLKT